MSSNYNEAKNPTTTNPTANENLKPGSKRRLSRSSADHRTDPLKENPAAQRRDLSKSSNVVNSKEQQAHMSKRDKFQQDSRKKLSSLILQNTNSNNAGSRHERSNQSTERKHIISAHKAQPTPQAAKESRNRSLIQSQSSHGQMLGVPRLSGALRKNSFGSDGENEEKSGLIPAELKNVLDEEKDHEYYNQQEKKSKKVDKNILIEEIDQFLSDSDLEEKENLSLHNPDALMSSRQLLANQSKKNSRRSRKGSEQIFSQLSRSQTSKREQALQEVQKGEQITTQSLGNQFNSSQQKRKSKVQQQGTLGSQSEKSQIFKEQMKKLVKNYLNRSQTAGNEETKGQATNENLKRQVSSIPKTKMPSSKDNSSSGKSNKNYHKIENSPENLLDDSFSEELEKQSKHKKFKYLIRVNGQFRVRWDLFVMILSIWNCYTLPFDVAFNPTDFETPFFQVMNSLIDFSFACDIFFNFRTTYLNRQTGDEVSDSKSIALQYLKSKLFIDLIATIPFDQVFAGILESHQAKQLQLLSILKLLRVLRLSKIITYMNATDEVKLSLKLFKMLFFLVMYLHCQACAWFYVVSQDYTWNPPVNIAYNNFSFFEDDVYSQYWMSFYSSLLILYGGDMSPRGNAQLIFLSLAYIFAALINANILGTIAVIIQTMNRRASRFQEQIDIANTAMKNMKLPEDLQRKVQDFMMFTQSNLDYQKQLDMFLNMISPSLRLQVTQHIFLNAISKNTIFKGNSELIRFVVHNIVTLLYLPEDIIIRQDSKAHHLFFLAQGTCEVWVRDQNKRDQFVRNLFQGMLFGEVALIAQVKRTASVKSKNYCTLAALNDENFYEMCHQFPDIFFKMKQETFNYADKWKTFQKKVISSIEYFANLSEDLIEELHYKLNLEYFEKGAEIFSSGDNCDALYFIVDGEIDLIIEQQNEEELLLDTLYTGCSIGAYSIIQQQKYPYSARARNNVTLLVLNRCDLYEAVEIVEELNYAIWDAEEFINNQGVPLCDYTIYRAIWRNNNVTLTPKQKFQNAVRRIKILNQRNKKKKIKFLDLIDKLTSNYLQNKYGPHAMKRPSLTLNNHKLRTHLSLAPFIQKHIVNQMKIKTADQGINYYQINKQKTNQPTNNNQNLNIRDQAIVSKLTFKIESLSDHIKKQNMQMLMMQRLFNQKINNLLEYQNQNSHSRSMSKNPSSYSQSSNIRTDDDQSGNGSERATGASDHSKKQKRGNREVQKQGIFQNENHLNPMINFGSYKSKKNNKKKQMKFAQQTDKLSQQKERFKSMQLESLNRQNQNNNTQQHTLLQEQKQMHSFQVRRSEQDKNPSFLDQNTLPLQVPTLAKNFSNNSQKSRDQTHRSKASNRYHNERNFDADYAAGQIWEETGATNMNFNRQDSADTYRPIEKAQKTQIQINETKSPTENRPQIKAAPQQKFNNLESRLNLEKPEILISPSKILETNEELKIDSQQLQDVRTSRQNMVLSISPQLDYKNGQKNRSPDSNQGQNVDNLSRQSKLSQNMSQQRIGKVQPENLNKERFHHLQSSINQQDTSAKQKVKYLSDAFLKLNLEKVLQNQNNEQQILDKMAGRGSSNLVLPSSLVRNELQKNESTNFLNYKNLSKTPQIKSQDRINNDKNGSTQSQNSSRSRQSAQHIYKDLSKEQALEQRVQQQFSKALEHSTKLSGRENPSSSLQLKVTSSQNEPKTQGQRQLSTQELMLLKMTSGNSQNVSRGQSNQASQRVASQNNAQRQGKVQDPRNVQIVKYPQIIDNTDDKMYQLPSQPPQLQKNRSSMKDDSNKLERVAKKVQIQHPMTQQNDLKHGRINEQTQNLRQREAQKAQVKQNQVLPVDEIVAFDGDYQRPVEKQNHAKKMSSKLSRGDLDQLKDLKIQLEKALSQQNQIHQNKLKDKEKQAQRPQQNDKIDRMATKEVNRMIEEELADETKKSSSANKKRRSTLKDKYRNIDQLLEKFFKQEISKQSQIMKDYQEEKDEIERRLQHINEEEDIDFDYYDYYEEE